MPNMNVEAGYLRQVFSRTEVDRRKTRNTLPP